MTSSLWQREFRGAQRRWWRQPWVVPVAILLASGTFWLSPGLQGEMDDTSAMAWPQHARPLLLGAIWIPQALLGLWIIWAVSAAFTRPGELRDAGALAATPLPSRTVALAKTLAPSYPATLALAGLGALQAGLAAVWGSGRLLHRLGHVVWVETLASPGTTLSERPLWPLFVLELPARGLLFGLFLATLTAWVSAGSRSTSAAAAKTLALCVGVFLLALAGDWIVYTELIRWDMLHMGASGTPPESWVNCARRLVLTELAYDFSARFLLPVLWLTWWWRWADRGYAQVQRRER